MTPVRQNVDPETLAYEFARKRSAAGSFHLGTFNATESLEEFIVRGWMKHPHPRHDDDQGPRRRVAALPRNGAADILFDAMNEMPRDRYAERWPALRQFIDRWSLRESLRCELPGAQIGDELSVGKRVETYRSATRRFTNFLRTSWSTLEDTLAGVDRE